jgi:hypothetical protein
MEQEELDKLNKIIAELSQEQKEAKARILLLENMDIQQRRMEYGSYSLEELRDYITFGKKKQKEPSKKTTAEQLLEEIRNNGLEIEAIFSRQRELEFKCRKAKAEIDAMIANLEFILHGEKKVPFKEKVRNFWKSLFSK